MQPGVLLLQLPEPGLDVVGGFGCSVGALLLEREHHAVLAVELGIGFVSVVRDHHRGHVLEVDGVNSLHVQIKQQQVLQGFQIGNLVTDGDHVVDPFLLHIAGRHGKVLGGENLGHHVHGDDFVQVGLTQGILPAVLDGVHAAFNLLQRHVQRSGTGSQFAGSGADFQHAFGFGSFQGLGSFLQLHLAALHSLKVLLQFRKGGICGGQLGFQFSNQGKNFLIGSIRQTQLGFGSSQGSLCRLIAALSGDQCHSKVGTRLQADHRIHGIPFGKGCVCCIFCLFQFAQFFCCRSQIRFCFIHLLFQTLIFRIGRQSCLCSLQRSLGSGDGSLAHGILGIGLLGRRLQFGIGRLSLQLRLQGFDSLNLHFQFRHGLAQLQQVFQSLDTRFQLICHRLQCQNLGLQCGFHGQQLRLLLIQLRLSGGGLVNQCVFSLVQLGLCAAHLALGVLQILLLLLQLLLGVVQFPVDGSDDFLIQSVNFLLLQHHMQLLLDFAGGSHSRHAGNALQAVHQGFVQKFRQGDGIFSFHRHCRHFYRQHGGVNFQHNGGAHRIFPTSGQAGDLLLNVHADGVHVHLLLKFQHDHTGIFTGGGADLLDVLQGRHGLLHGFADLRFHLFRAGAGVGSDNNHIGKVHIGQQIRGHPGISHHAQYQHRNHRYKHRQRLFNRKFPHTMLLAIKSQHTVYHRAPGLSMAQL